MNGSPSKPLSKDDMYALFETLSERLRRKGARANIYLVGGAVMALAFDRERITGDIDARIDTGHGALVEAVHEIAAERGLATNWLNEQAASAIPKTPDARAPTLYATQYLVVTGASAEHMLAMKLEAGRGRDVSGHRYAGAHARPSKPRRGRRHPPTAAAGLEEEHARAHGRRAPQASDSGDTKRRNPATAAQGATTAHAGETAPTTDRPRTRLNGAGRPRAPRRLEIPP